MSRHGFFFYQFWKLYKCGGTLFTKISQKTFRFVTLLFLKKRAIIYSFKRKPWISKFEYGSVNDEKTGWYWDRKKAIQEPSLAQDIIQLLLKIVIIIFAIILIFTFLYGIARINDVSMKPAIKDGDLVMYYRLDKRFVSGDVAVFEDNGRNTTGRVVAVAGDTVDITKDLVTRMD